MAISFVGSAPPIQALNGGNISLLTSTLRNESNVNDPPQLNDLWVIAYAHSGTADAVIATPSGFTKYTDLFVDATTYDVNFAIFYKFSTGVNETVTLVGPTGNSFACLTTMMSFRGVDTTTPFDVAFTSSSKTTNANPSFAAITPVTAGAWIGVVGSGSAATLADTALPADLSASTNHFRQAWVAETNDIKLGMGLKTNWSSGAFTPTGWGSQLPSGNATASLGVAFALRPAGGAPVSRRQASRSSFFLC